MLFSAIVLTNEWPRHLIKIDRSRVDEPDAWLGSEQQHCHALTELVDDRVRERKAHEVEVRMRMGGRRWQSALSIVLLASLVATLVAVGTEASAGAALSCNSSRPLVIGVRGSGDPRDPHDGDRSAGTAYFGSTVGPAISALVTSYGKPAETSPLDYPAASIELLNPVNGISGVKEYFASVLDGVEALITRLTLQERACSTRPLVLVGYSQGALVVNRALVTLDALHDPVLDQIAAVALIADPQRIGISSYARGNAPRDLDGITIGLGLLPNQQLPNAVRTRSDSWCHAGDIICAPSATLVGQLVSVLTTPFGLGLPTQGIPGYFEVKNGFRTHQQYAQRGEAHAAGVEAAMRLSRFRADQLKTTRAQQGLSKLTPGLETVLVQTGGGFEAAAYDQVGNIEFWRYGQNWQLVGKSTYPQPQLAGETGRVRVTGEVPTGMSDAVFIADGPFTGDGSGDTLAFTNGPNGWGVIATEVNGNLASTGRGLNQIGPGLELYMSLNEGRFETRTDWNATGFSEAFAAGYPIIRDWNWTGHDFALGQRQHLHGARRRKR